MSDKEKKNSFEEMIEDMFYACIGAAAKIESNISEDLDEFIKIGKEVSQKNKDFNEELKHTVKDMIDKEIKEREKDSKKSKKKDVQSILDDLNAEEKKHLKEALLNEGKAKK